MVEPISKTTVGTKNEVHQLQGFLSACLCGSYVPERTLTLSLDLLIDRYFIRNCVIGCLASFRDVNHISLGVRRGEFDSRRI